MGQDILVSVPSRYPLVILDSLLGALTHQNSLKRRISFILIGVVYIITFISIYSARHQYVPASIRTAKLEFDNDMLADAQAAVYTEPTQSLAQRQSWIRLNKLVDSRSSAYPLKLFTDRALRMPNARVVGVTAVVLHWKRRKGLELVIKQLTKYPFIREVIVWNNRPGIELKASDFVVSRHSASLLPEATLRIYNSPSNMHDLGKHFACSLASYAHCYFNDDDWLNIYLDSQYTKYIECCDARSADGDTLGGRIVSNTMPIIHLEHRRWRFENPDIDMHTSFTWLGTGSFFPRQLSARFLQQQSSLPDEFRLTRAQGMTADMFFSLWTNDHVEQMPNDLVPIDVEGGEVGWSRSAGVDQWAVVYANILHAVRALHSVLSSSPHLVPSVFPISTPPPESHVRSPCANDGCLFSTSLTPFPPPEALQHGESASGGFFKNWWRRGSSLVGWVIPFRSAGGAGDEGAEVTFDPFEINHVKEYEQRWNDVATRRDRITTSGGASGTALWKWPDEEWWVRNGSWHLAVDGKGVETCWESWRAPEADDHFGLTLVAPRFVRKIKITGSPDLAEVLAWEHAAGGGDESWQLFTVRQDSIGGWQSRRFLTPSPKIRPVAPGLIEVTLELEPLIAEALWYRLEEQDEATAEALGLNRNPDRRDITTGGNADGTHGGTGTGAGAGGYHEGEEVAIRKIKLVSRGKKRNKLRVCQWEIDGWVV